MNASTIEEEALALPLQERAKLIERLLESLDNLPEREADVLWLDVAERRAREIDEGQVQLVTPEELERRIQARLKSITCSIQMRRWNMRSKSPITRNAASTLVGGYHRAMLRAVESACCAPNRFKIVRRRISERSHFGLPVRSHLPRGRCRGTGTCRGASPARANYWWRRT